VVQARLYDFDKSVEEAAMDLGASPVGTFFQVTLPIIAPSVISAWLLSFTLSLDDLVIASFATGPGATTLPMKIYSQVRLGVTPEINAISSIMIGVVTLGVLVASYTTRQAAAREQREKRAVDAGAA
jgi:putrescine transport system permease protein